jgi:bacterial/archaeal transporter family protein
MSASMGVFFAIISMVVYGVSDILLAKSSRKTGEYPTIFWRSILLSLMLLAVALAVEGTALVPLKHLPILLLLGVIGVASYYTYSKALKVGFVSVVSPFAHSAVIITVILSFIFLGERMSLLQSVAVGLIIIGMVFISIDFKEIRKMRVRQMTKGMGYAMLTFIGWGAFSFILRLAIDRVGPYLAAFYMEAIGAAVLLLVLPFSSGVKVIGKNSLCIIFFLAATVVIADIASNVAITQVMLSIVAPIMYSASLVGIILATIFLKERLTLTQKLAAGSIILGIILVSV